MTITQATSAPLIAVVGATGAQGKSVIKALTESNKPYRIRGFTRDATKPAAQAAQGPGHNKDAVYRAFAGADYAFLVTNFWEHADMQKEISEGKLLIDAAKAAGVKGIVWSGLVSVNKSAAGSTRTSVTSMARPSYQSTVAPLACLSSTSKPDLYATNFLANPTMLGKQPDGTYAIAWAVRPTTVLPIIDIEHDYGLYVQRALEQPVFPDGEEVYTTSEDITVENLARQLSEATGKQVVFKQISVEEWTKAFAAMGVPPVISNEIIDGFRFFDEVGYYGGQPTASREGLAKKTRTWAEFVKEADWSKAFV
ncbi:NAD(P)-binding protein [Mycena olivaceomarginata]|nr:NAD(P)-binding protein [Mycena olivaceomarginata]